MFFYSSIWPFWSTPPMQQEGVQSKATQSKTVQGKTKALWFACLTLVTSLMLTFSFPWSGQAFPLEEWENLDTSTNRSVASVKIQPGRSWKEPMSGMTLLWIPGGCLKMGSPPSSEGRDADEGPVHPVCVSGFWLGEKEITQGQWQNIMQQNPAKFRKDKSYPIERISRMDVENFTARLNIHYQGRVVFGLPTEAQWEYACRNGGQKVLFPGYDQVDQLSWYRVNSHGSTQATGTRSPNRLGLFDMSGNVWEWVQDTYDKAAYSQPNRHTGRPINDPVYIGTTPFSVVRGGGWDDAVSTVRCTNRGFQRFLNKQPNLGARLAVKIDFKIEENTEVQQENTKEMPF